MTESTSYFRATHHPWLCLLFLFPLLAVYEGGVYLLGGTNPQSLRNGADAWLRWVLDIYSVKPYLAAPAIIVAVFFLVEHPSLARSAPGYDGNLLRNVV